mgnify:CR=1 FL=1
MGAFGTAVKVGFLGWSAWQVFKPKSASAAVEPPPGGEPVPPVEPPPVEPPPPAFDWPAPRDLEPAANLPRAGALFLVSPVLANLFRELPRPLAAPPLAYLYATAQLAGGLALPPQRRGRPWVPTGLRKRHIAAALGRDPTPAEYNAAADDPRANVLAAGLLLFRLHGRALALAAGVRGWNSPEAVSHMVRIAWLDNEAALDKIIMLRAPPDWYVTEGPHGQPSHDQAWSDAWRRWLVVR